MGSSAASPRKTRAEIHLASARDVAEPRKGRLHSDAVSVLRDMIQTGELPPGERLMEKPMSARLGMSRTPVREAFRTLAVEGLVKLLPNQGAIVAELDEKEAVNAFLVLGALEALAARQACELISEEELDDLQQLQDDLEQYYQAGDRARYTTTNRLIHRLMVEASRNSSLIAAWSMIVPRAERPRSLNNIDAKRWAASIDSHRNIFAALMARDGHLLSSLMQSHFAHSIIDNLAKLSRANGETRPAPRPPARPAAMRRPQKA